MGAPEGPGRLRLPDAPRGRQRRARQVPRVRHEAARGRGRRASYVCPMHPEVVSDDAGHVPEVRHEAACRATAVAVGSRPRHEHDEHDEPTRSTRTHEHHDHDARPTPAGSSGKTTWSRSTGSRRPANMRWKLVDRDTGAENHAIDWQFRVGDRVKIRLVNEMDSDHPMHHPFHIHGAGRFVVLARDGVAGAEPRLEGHRARPHRRDRRHPARRHQPRPLDGALPHRRAPRERDDVQLRRPAGRIDVDQGAGILLLV